MVLVNHILCRKEITLPRVVKLIGLALLHFWNKAMLEKVENNGLVVSGNNESQITSKKDHVLG